MRGGLINLAIDPRRSWRTVRFRLTCLYGGLFLISGAALLGVTYALMDHALGQPLYSGTRQPARPDAAGIVRGTGPSSVQSQHAADLHQLLVQSGIALCIMAIVSIALGWIIAGRVLRPLRTITVAARQISEHNLHERLALDGPRDELTDLGDTIDGLLARLECAFDSQRRFVANASHELRTPLTVSRAMLQVALASPKTTLASLRATCEDVLEADRQSSRS